MARKKGQKPQNDEKDGLSVIQQEKGDGTERKSTEPGRRRAGK